MRAALYDDADGLCQQCGSNISRLADTLHGHYTDEEFTELSRRMLQIRRQRRLKDNKDVEHG